MKSSKAFAVLALVMLLTWSAPRAFAGRSVATMNVGQERVAVQQLRDAANAGRLARVSGLLAASATLRVDGKQWRGRVALTRWWRDQVNHHVQITFQSPLSVRGSTVAVLVQRKTRGGDCASACVEQLVAVFSGSHIGTLTLQRIVPPSGHPAPGSTAVPPPPPSGPPPKVTPTVPS